MNYNYLFPVYDATDFQIRLGFLMNSFSNMTKKVRKKIKYVKNEKSYFDGIQSISNHLERPFIEAKNNLFGMRESDFKFPQKTVAKID